MTTREAMAYIAINRACGCATGIVVDDGLYPKDVAKCVADFIKDGRDVQHVALEDGLARVGPCTHLVLGAERSGRKR